MRVSGLGVWFITLSMGAIIALPMRALAEDCGTANWRIQGEAGPKIFTTTTKAPKGVTSAEGCKKLEDFADHERACGDVASDHKRVKGPETRFGFAQAGGFCAICSSHDGVKVTYEKRTKSCKFDCTFSGCQIGSPTSSETMLPVVETPEEAE